MVSELIGGFSREMQELDLPGFPFQISLVLNNFVLGFFIYLFFFIENETSLISAKNFAQQE
jgi:hypothetical protein